MNQIDVGTKVYSYCYGPMTVVRTDETTLYATMDDYEGASEKIQLYDRLTPEHRFYLDAIGHWVFLSAEEVGRENDGFPHECQPSNHLKVNSEMVHSFFRGRFTAANAKPGGEASAEASGSSKRLNTVTVVEPEEELRSAEKKLNTVTVVEEDDDAVPRKSTLNTVTVVDDV